MQSITLSERVFGLLALVLCLPLLPFLRSVRQEFLPGLVEVFGPAEDLDD